METIITKINPDKPTAKTINDAAGIIDAGGLVAFPTETVYGIACRVQEKSLHKLNQIKGRTAEKHYTLHIAEKTGIEQYVPKTGLRAQKLIRTAWPGPLTIVFELDTGDIEQQKGKLEHEVFQNLYKTNSIGIRCPDNPIARTLLQAVSNPVVAPSANITGQTPATDAQEVSVQFSGKIEMVLDGGLCKYKTSSTVVKIGKASLEIL